MLVVKVNQNVAVHPVTSQQDEHDKIGNQQRAIECVGVVEALKSFVQQVLAEIRSDAARTGIRSELREK
jgi:hypothetical protein